MSFRFLFAHGAGASSASDWMQRYAELLGRLGPVRAFDYPYMQRPGRKAPDKLEALIAAHQRELSSFRGGGEPSDRLLLAGKSMGSRVGCHVALTESVSGCVCFGYPLRGQNGKLRDQVLLELKTPVLFVQGTRDALCALPELDEVRKRMHARSELYVVESGDHSLEATKTWLKTHGATQDSVEANIVAAVQRFCKTL